MSTTSLQQPLGKPLRQPRWFEVLIDHNPCYLLSGVCLLIGCFLISTALADQRDQVGPVLALLGVVEVYQWLVLGLGLYLLVGRRLVRDGGMLLLLALLLLSDGAFLHNEMATASGTLGGTINAAAVAVGLVQVGLMAWGLRLRLGARLWALLAINLSLVMALPVVLRALVQAEQLTTGVMYALWWVAGAWLAVQSIVPWPRRRGPRVAVGLASRRALRELMRRALLVVPAGAVLLHLMAAHYVYESPWHVAYAAPLLLGAGVYLVRQWPAGRDPRPCRWAVVLGVLAILASLAAPSALLGEAAWPMVWAVSPLRLVLVAAAGVWAFIAWRQRDPWLLGPSTLAMLAGVSGASPGVMVARWWEWVRRGYAVGAELLPSSPLQWGVVAVVAAFVLLAAGVGVSLLKAGRGADTRS